MSRQSIIGGLRVWSEEEILIREQAVQRIRLAVETGLREVNPSVTFMRVEAPVIVPRSHISSHYTEDDVFELGEFRTDTWALRAETTLGSYQAAHDLIRSGKAKLPLCVWQAGLSFRKEQNDGARASTLRFNQFWQQEFQFIYRSDSKADYALVARRELLSAIKSVTGHHCWLDHADPPSYATETVDVVTEFNGKAMEVASTSKRTDFPQVANMPEQTVLELAVGLDRLVAVARGEP